MQRRYTLLLLILTTISVSSSDGVSASSKHIKPSMVTSLDAPPAATKPEGGNEKRFLRTTNPVSNASGQAKTIGESSAMSASDDDERALTVKVKAPAVTMPKVSIKIPGLSNAFIRFKMEIWYYHRLPPTNVWRMLGLRGTKAPREHPYFKYWYWYAEAWRKAQPVMP